MSQLLGSVEGGADDPLIRAALDQLGGDAKEESKNQGGGESGDEQEPSKKRKGGEGS